MLIPKTLHYVWVGSKPLPAETVQAVANWQRIMPDFSVRQWNESNIDFSAPFIRSAYAMRAFNRTANYARLLALYRHGGIYFDHDIEVLRDFTPLLGHGCFYGCQSNRADDPNPVNNAVIGAAPGHPFIARLLAEMDKLDGTREVGPATGPGLVSAALREAGLAAPVGAPAVVGGVTVFPAEYFYPYGFMEEFTPECITANSYCVHHWAHSWKKQPSRKARWTRRFTRGMARISISLAFGVQKLGNTALRRLRAFSG